MGKINDVLIAMAKVDRLNEADVFELCDKHELDMAEEMVIMSMYHNAIGNNESLSVAEALSEPELPKVNVNKQSVSVMSGDYVFTKGFGQ